MESEVSVAGLADFAEIIRENEPLAPHTGLKLGGPAEYLIEPRSLEELSAVVRCCLAETIPYRVLGSGWNLLVSDQGVRGAVLRLSAPCFAEVKVEGARAIAGSGVTLSTVISEAARHSLGGLETLVGARGTLGGALRCNVGERIGEIGQFVRRVHVLDNKGNLQTREGDEIRFGAYVKDLDDPILLTIELELEKDDPDLILKRMRKAWIHRKSNQTLSFQPGVRLFQNPRGLNAAAIIEQAGMQGTQVGGAQVSERDPNCVVLKPEATSRDVLRLAEMIRARAREQLDVELEMELTVW